MHLFVVFLMEKTDKIALFEDKSIRKIWHNDQWFFSVEDIVYALTDSSDTKQYIKKMRSRNPQLQLNWGTICTPPFR
jgi:DNA-damage-inducible protein D